MSGAYKALIILGIAALPILAILIDEVASSSAQIIKNVEYTPKPTKTTSNAPKTASPFLDDTKKTSSVTPKRIKSLTSPYEMSSVAKDDFQALLEFQRNLSVEELNALKMPSLEDIVLPSSPKCGSSRLRYRIRSELQDFRDSEDFSSFATSKVHNKLSDVLSTNIAQINPVSVDAKFLENDITVSVALPCGIESFSTSLTDGNWGDFESKGLKVK